MGCSFDIYTFGRRFYPMWRTVHSGYTLRLFVCSLGIELMTLSLLVTAFGCWVSDQISWTDYEISSIDTQFIHIWDRCLRVTPFPVFVWVVVSNHWNPCFSSRAEKQNIYPSSFLLSLRITSVSLLLSWASFESVDCYVSLGVECAFKNTLYISSGFAFSYNSILSIVKGDENCQKEKQKWLEIVLKLFDAYLDFGNSVHLIPQ